MRYFMVCVSTGVRFLNFPFINKKYPSIDSIKHQVLCMEYRASAETVVVMNIIELSEEDYESYMGE